MTCPICGTECKVTYEDTDGYRLLEKGEECFQCGLYAESFAYGYTELPGMGSSVFDSPAKLIYDVNLIGWNNPLNWENTIMRKMVRRHDKATGWYVRTAYEVTL